MKLNDYATQCNEIAEASGWNDPPVTFPEFCALVHSEVSEAFEEFRNGHSVTRHGVRESRKEFPSNSWIF